MRRDPNTAYDGMMVMGFELDGEVVGGELQAAVVVEVLTNNRLQIKGGIADTGRPMSKPFQLRLLKLAVQVLEEDLGI